MSGGGQGMSEDDPKMRRPLVPLVAAAASACVGLTAVAAGSSTSSASSSAAPSDPEGIAVQVPDSNERVEEFWTQDRMRAAQPMPTPRINRPAAPPAAGGEGVEE